MIWGDVTELQRSPPNRTKMQSMMTRTLEHAHAVGNVGNNRNGRLSYTTVFALLFGH
jgi:hypothetical protein